MDIVRVLRADGIAIIGSDLSGVPLQVEGWLPTGQPFYFRIRGARASLKVGKVSSASRLDHEWVELFCFGPTDEVEHRSSAPYNLNVLNVLAEFRALEHELGLI